jgi:Domain of unknown function (DUF4351)
MSQFPHDQFAKDLLENLLTPFGKVETDRKISSEVREIDVCFSPAPSSPNLPSLGLLQKLAFQGAAFEPFRNPVSANEIRSCMGKLFDWHGELNRQANREGKAKPTISELPYLWILTPTLAAGTLTGFGAITEIDEWGKGVYLLPSEQRTGIVVIHQLPENPDTLWLRLLGKGNVQHRAIEEINRLTEDSSYRNNVLELLSDLKVVLEAKKSRNKEDKELLMSLRTSPLYLEQIDLARNEGENRGERKVILKLLNRKFGALPVELVAKIDNLSSERLDSLSETLLDFQKMEDLIVWLDENR